MTDETLSWLASELLGPETAQELIVRVHESRMRQRDILKPAMLIMQPKAIARIEMYRGRLAPLQESLDWINRLAEEMALPDELLTPRAQQLARDCAVMNAAMAAGDDLRAAELAESILAVASGSSSDGSVVSVTQGWPLNESVRSAVAVRILTRHELEVAPWMGADVRASVHYRRGEREEAREVLREELNKVLLEVNFGGRKTCSPAWYLCRALREEIEAIPAGERTPEESRLLEALQRAL